MPEQVCATCRWWGTVEIHSHEPSPKTWKACAQTHSVYGKPARLEQGRSIAQDYESYEAILMTAPDFGCNQWQARDEPDAA